MAGLIRKLFWLPLIRVHGSSFKSVLKDDLKYGVKFLIFSNPTDNPFSFSSGMCIAFQEGLRTDVNEFELIGIMLTSTPVFEYKVVDFR